MSRWMLILLFCLPACATAPKEEPAERGAIPRCEPLSSPSVTQTVEGLAFPQGSHLTEVEPEGPLIRVEGLVDKTPVQVREELEENPNLRILQVEDEGYEAEALVSDGKFRNFIKAVLVCEGRSRLRGYVTSEENAKELPEIKGEDA